MSSGSDGGLHCWKSWQVSTKLGSLCIRIVFVIQSSGLSTIQDFIMYWSLWRNGGVSTIQGVPKSMENSWDFQNYGCLLLSVKRGSTVKLFHSPSKTLSLLNVKHLLENLRLLVPAKLTIIHLLWVWGRRRFNCHRSHVSGWDLQWTWNYQTHVHMSTHPTHLHTYTHTHTHLHTHLHTHTHINLLQ